MTLPGHGLTADMLRATRQARRRAARDIVLGVLFSVLGLVAVVFSFDVTPMPGMVVGMGLFPRLTGAGLMVFGGALTVHAWRAWREEPRPYGRGFCATIGGAFGTKLDTASLEPVFANEACASFTDRAFSPALIAAVLGLMVLMPILGFLITTMLFAGVIVRISGGSWRAALIFSPVLTWVVYALFFYGLRVPLPVAVWAQ